MAIAGRVEAKLTVPSGGAAVDASTGAHASPVTVTVPAGDYYLTAAGGVSGLLETLQDLLNDNVQGYPLNASAMNDAVTAGTWSAGWLCNESSGNLAAEFGGVTLTPSGAPTYGTPGPRGGIDKAVGFDSTDAFVGGTSDFDVDGSSDLIIAAVVKLTGDLMTGTPCRIVHKRGGGAGYTLYMTRNSPTSAGFSMVLHDGTDQIFPSILTIDWAVHANTWIAVLAVVERATNTARVAAKSLATGELFIGPGADISAVGSMSNASAFNLGSASQKPWYLAALYIGTGAGAASGMSAAMAPLVNGFANAISAAWSVAMDDSGVVTIANSGWPSSIAWTSAALRDLLGFGADMQDEGSVTGTKAARGVWFPSAALNVEGSDPRRAPRVTDLRTTTSPTGRVLGLVGPSFRRHRNITWELVPEFRVWEASADVPNNTWETFFADTQLGEHAWFGVSSPIQIYDHAGNRVGQDADVSGWQITGLDSIDPKRVGDWTGLWTVTLPEIVSSG